MDIQCSKVSMAMIAVAASKDNVHRHRDVAVAMRVSWRALAASKGDGVVEGRKTRVNCLHSDECWLKEQIDKLTSGKPAS